MTKEELLVAAAQAEVYPKGHGYDWFSVPRYDDSRIMDLLLRPFWKARA